MKIMMTIIVTEDEKVISTTQTTFTLHNILPTKNNKSPSSHMINMVKSILCRCGSGLYASQHFLLSIVTKIILSGYAGDAIYQ